MNTNDIFRNCGIEITLQQPDDFLKVKETLTRIGVSSRKDKTLYQSCHILHKQNRYVIIHFKELFSLDNRSTDLTENDIHRRNAIAKLLQDWGLIKIINPSILTDGIAPIHQIKILSHKDKSEWKLVSKYNIGKKKY
jgi:hypothetical protein